MTQQYNNRSYSKVAEWVNAGLSFVSIRAAILWLREARTTWRTLGAEDGGRHLLVIIFTYSTIYALLQ